MEREGEKKILRERSARRTKKGGGRQGAGRGGKEVDGGDPPVHHLVHPSRKKHKCYDFSGYG